MRKETVPTVFHGTGLNDAHSMAGPPGQIDVTLGGGEFGRGLYTQYSERRALAWAIRVSARLNGPPCVLRLDIDDAEYGKFAILYLDAQTGPALTDDLDNTGQRRTYVDGSHDLIEGPIMGNVRHMQQKFESAHSQAVLNGASTTRTVI
jgi:hypothetical protein